jgi:hypothetical protein
MSVRAYKIIEYADNSSFNLWSDREFMDLLEKVIGSSRLGSEGVGELDISEDNLIEMQKIFEKGKNNYTIEQQEELIEIFDKIKSDMEDGSVIYLCF